MSRIRIARTLYLSSIGLAASLVLAGCHGHTSTSAVFTPSMTPTTPGLVKLVETGHSGSRIVVDALLIGPEPGLDLFAFKFGIAIGDPTIARFVPQPSYTQTALVADAGQTIAVDVDDSNPSLIQVSVSKLGGGAGNGVAGASASVIQLAFDVAGSGATTMTLAGRGAVAPQALDSRQVPIPAVTFDAASAGVQGVTTGGGY